MGAYYRFYELEYNARFRYKQGSMKKGKVFLFSYAVVALLCGSCAQTEVIESPKTAYVADVGTPTEPVLIWTSRTLDKPYDYLGQIKARSWTYDGALERLKDAGKQLRADAIVDIHFQRLGFFKTMHAFAIKFKE